MSNAINLKTIKHSDSPRSVTASLSPQSARLSAALYLLLQGLISLNSPGHHLHELAPLNWLFLQRRKDSPSLFCPYLNMCRWGKPRCKNRSEVFGSQAIRRLYNSSATISTSRVPDAWNMNETEMTWKHRGRTRQSRMICGWSSLPRCRVTAVSWTSWRHSGVLWRRDTVRLLVLMVYFHKHKHYLDDASINMCKSQPLTPC